MKSALTETTVKNPVEYIPYATTECQVPQIMHNSKIMRHHPLKCMVMNKSSVFYSMSTFKKR